MRVACVLVTHLRAKVEMYRHPHLRDVPVVIVDRGNFGDKASCRRPLPQGLRREGRHDAGASDFPPQ